MTDEPIDFSWATRGACRNYDTAVFYPERDTPKWALRIREAKQICLTCSVRVNCAGYALKYEVIGIWGGMTETERTRVRNSSNIPLQRERFGLQHYLPMERRKAPTNAG